MRFFTSDTHFSHARIIELCHRPFVDVDDMNEALVDNWNSVVGVDDVVYHMGDVALGPWKSWDAVLSRLNGEKNLIVGNHDRLFHERSTNKLARWNAFYSQYFSQIHDMSQVLIDDHVLNLSHFPYDGDSHDEDRFDSDRILDEGIPLVHGHTHSDNVISYSKNGTLQIQVGVDANNFTPVSEEQIVNYIKISHDTRLI